MKKIILSLVLLFTLLKGFSQTCEEREDKLLQLIGSYSAGFFYNTFGLIGSISDGYDHDAYTAAVVTNLINAQKKLSENMIVVLEKIIGQNLFKNETDKNYATASVSLLKGLKLQMDLLLDLADSKTQKRINAYEAQRNKNWKDLSKLMGIDE